LKSLIVLSLVAFSLSFSQTSAPDTTVVRADSLFLRVVIPEEDTVQRVPGRFRIAACTTPTAKAYINDREVKVYASGAFVGLLKINVGENPLRLKVVSPAGDSLWRDFVLIRPQPPQTSSHDTLQIDSIMMEPPRDVWLNEGDVLEVQFKGSPGYEASFSIDGVESGIPMRELPPSEASGFKGVYAGRYVVRSQDEAQNAEIEFRLKKSFWSKEYAKARGTVTITPGQLPRVAEIKEDQAFLNVGLGSDRLGGAKYGYLPAGVRVLVTGQVGRQYRVQLCEDMTAWLPAFFATLLPPETALPKSLTGSISVAGDDSADVVTVNLSQRLPYLSDLTVNPTALLVDVFGATSNTNWITQQPTARGIQSVSWDQIGEDHYRLTIALNYAQAWGYDIGYNSNSNLVIRLRRPPVVANPDSALKGMTIAVDAGHGGDNLGALGSTGVLERDVNLSLAYYLKHALEARGASVVLTRVDSNNVSMSDRAQIAVNSGAQLLVSIHCNSIGYTTDPESTKGTGTFYRYLGFQPLANIVFDRVIETGLYPFGVTGSFNFYLNSPTQMPNVLVETAFLSNPEDEMKLLDDSFRQEVTEKIAVGLEEFVRKYALPAPLSEGMPIPPAAR
jgi:N-acetylmuramoyl-L-alanine amidase